MNNSRINKAPLWGRLLLSGNILTPILVMAVSALVFTWFEWDLVIQSFYYRNGWYMNEIGWVQFIYHYGNIPALLLSIGSLVLLFRSFTVNSMHSRNRKLYLFLVLAMIIGPGIIVNSALKENWGRPRPRDVEQFGGRYAYEAPLEIDLSSPGKSFPCGHATMGFYFFAPALLCGLWKRRYLIAVNIFALLYGSLIGWVRVMQGGHFASDVIFSGALIYLCSHILWRVMNLDIHPFYEAGKKRASMKKGHKVLLVLVGVMIVFAVMLATPYNRKQTLRLQNSEVAFADYYLLEANVQLSFSDSTYIRNQSVGFGFPGSKSRLEKRETADSLVVRQSIKGMFTELDNDLIITADTLALDHLSLQVRKGTIEIMANPDIQTQNGGTEDVVELNVGGKCFKIQAPKIIYKGQP